MQDLAFSTDGRFLFSLNPDSSASVWNLTPLREIGPLIAAGKRITRILPSPDGKYLIVGARDGRTRVLDAITHQEITTLLGDQAPVVPVGFLAQGTTLVTVDDAGVIAQWDTTSWTLRVSSPGPCAVHAAPSAMAVTPGANYLLLAPSAIKRKGQVIWWDLSRSTVLAEVETQCQGALSRLAVSPAGQLLADSLSDLGTGILEWPSLKTHPVADPTPRHSGQPLSS